MDAPRTDLNATCGVRRAALSPQYCQHRAGVLVRVHGGNVAESGSGTQPVNRS